MVGRARIAHPSQRLRQRAVRIRGLPTTDQIELAAQAVKDVAFAAKNPDRLMGLPVTDGDVEVTAEHKVCAAAQRRYTIENVLHRADVSAFTDRSVNAEYH